VRQHERRRLERRLGQAAAAGLPLLETGQRATEELRTAWADDWSSRGWLRRDYFSGGAVPLTVTVPDDVRARLDRAAERLGLTLGEALFEAEALGFRHVSNRRTTDAGRES
jgi:hypothetical protein